MKALLLIIIWWILVQLSAPTFLFFCLGVVGFVMLLGAISDALKAAIEYADKRDK